MLQILDAEVRTHQTYPLLLTANILFSIMLLLSSCTEATPGTEHLSNSISYMEDGDLNSAIIEAKNAVAKLPTSAAGRKILGQLYLEMGDLESAERELNIARELSVSDYSLVAPLARSLVRQGKGEQVLSIDLSGLSNEDKADTLVSIAYAHLAYDGIDAAASSVALARELDPASTYALLALAKINLLKEQDKSAQSLIQRAIELEPNNQKAWELTGDIHWRQGNIIEAETAYDIASGITPNSFTSILKSAQIKTQLGKFEEAQEIAIELKKKVGDNPDIEFLHGLILYYQADLKTAQTYFEKTLVIDSNHESAVYQLSITHLRLGNFGQASEYARKHLLLNPGSTRGKKLFGRIQIENKNYKLAEELIKPLVLLDNGDVIASRLLASALFKQGKMDEAVSVLTTASADNIESSDVLYQSDSDILLRDLDSGYTSEMGIYTSQQNSINEILHLVNNDQLNQALSKAGEFVARTPDGTTPWNLLGNIQFKLDDLKSAEASFTEANKLSPGNPTAGHFLAEIALKNTNASEARNRYEHVLEHNPNHLQTLLALAYLNALSDNQDAMIDRLEEARNSNPNALKPKILLARFNISIGSEDEAIEILQTLPLSQKNRPAALITLALAQLQALKFEDARSTLDRLNLVQEKNPAWHYLVSKVYVGLYQYEAARLELAKALELDKNYDPAKNELANLVVLLSDINSDVLPDSSSTSNSIQSVPNANSDMQIAIDQKGSDLVGSNYDSTQIDIQFAKAKKHWHLGNRSGAIKILKELKSDLPDNLKIRHTLALGYADSGNIENAITEFEDILVLNSADHIALNNLAWYTKDKDPGQALEYAIRASEIAPDVLEIIDTIAAIKIQTNDLEGASSTLSDRSVSNSTEPSIIISRARILAKTGNKPEAIRIITDLINKNDLFPLEQEASTLLNELNIGN